MSSFRTLLYVSSLLVSLGLGLTGVGSGQVSRNSGQLELVLGPTAHPSVDDNGSYIDEMHAFVAGIGRIERTVDGGITWQVMTPKAMHEFNDIYRDSLAKVFFLTPMRGWLVINDKTWITEDGGSTLTTVFNQPYEGLAFADATHGWLNIYENGRYINYVTRTTGRSWQACGEGDNGPGNVHFVTAEFAWGIGSERDPRLPPSAPQGTVMQTTDGGCTWNTVWRGNEMKQDRFIDIASTSRTDVWVTGVYTGSLFHSADGGKTWRVVAIPGVSSHAAYVYFLNSRQGWILFYDGIEGAEIAHTINGADTWTVLTRDEIRKPDSLPLGWKEGKLFQMLLRRVADRRSVSLVHPAPPNPSGMTNLTKIEYDFSLFEREGPQRHVAYFFNFDQKMFQASVSYWKSESKGPEREQVLKDIVQSLRHENNPPKSAGSQASPETNGASTVQVGAVSLWKTLINRAGWSVQCPPGWKVLSCTYCPDVTDPDVFVSFHPPSGHGVITIEHLADKPVNRSTDQWFDWIEHAADANVRMSEETMSLDGRQAVRVRYRYLDAPETEAEREILYVIDKSRTFEISVWVDERGVSIENQLEYPIYQQMLSTFRFTDH